MLTLGFVLDLSGPPLFWKLCPHRPTLGICSWTRGLPDIRKWVFCDVTGLYFHQRNFLDISYKSPKRRRSGSKHGNTAISELCNVFTLQGAIILNSAKLGEQEEKTACCVTCLCCLKGTVP